MRAAARLMADLAVWSEDPYTAALPHLWEIPTDMTLAGGEILYQGGEISLLLRQARCLWGWSPAGQLAPAWFWRAAEAE